MSLGITAVLQPYASCCFWSQFCCTNPTKTFSGDEAVAKIVEHAAQMIGQVVGNLVNVILPDVIVLGGGLVAAMPTRFLNPVRAAAAARAMPAFVDSFEIVAAKLSDESAVMGTAAWAQYQVDEKVGV